MRSLGARRCRVPQDQREKPVPKVRQGQREKPVPKVQQDHKACQDRKGQRATKVMLVRLAFDTCRRVAQSVAMILKRLCRCSVQKAGLLKVPDVERYQQ